MAGGLGIGGASDTSLERGPDKYNFWRNSIVWVQNSLWRYFAEGKSLHIPPTQRQGVAEMSRTCSMMLPHICRPTECRAHDGTPCSPNSCVPQATLEPSTGGPRWAGPSLSGALFQLESPREPDFHHVGTQSAPGQALGSPVCQSRVP